MRRLVSGGGGGGWGCARWLLLSCCLAAAAPARRGRCWCPAQAPPRRTRSLAVHHRPSLLCPPPPAPMIEADGEHFSRRWGYLSRAGVNDKSQLMRQVRRARVGGSAAGRGAWRAARRGALRHTCTPPARCGLPLLVCSPSSLHPDRKVRRHNCHAGKLLTAACAPVPPSSLHPDRKVCRYLHQPRLKPAALHAL